MRRRVSITLLLSLLVCAIATRELPELTQLVDNTSNDYSTVVFQKNSSPNVTHQAPTIARYILSAVRVLDFVPPTINFKPIESVSPCSDLLHLLCIQRT